MPRQERRKQRVARGFLAFLAGLAVIAAIGWFFRDQLLALRPTMTPTPVVQALVTTPVPELNTPAPALAASPAPTSGPVLANLLSTATPTPPPPTAAAPTPAPALEDTGAVRPAGEEAGAGAGETDPSLTPLVDLLPSLAEVPDGLAVTQTGERAKADVVLSLAGDDEAASAEAAQLLDEWGWEGNAFRDFVVPDGGVTTNGVSFMNVSIHRFANDDAADRALTYFSDQVVDLDTFEVEPVGDNVIALRGSPQGVALAVLYVRQGSTMYRISGAGTPDGGGDPTADVVSTAQNLLAR